MKADQERVKVLLTDTVTLLCRNGLHFQKQLRVQGVLGITVDDTDVFIVHINESFNSSLPQQQQPLAPAPRDDQSGNFKSNVTVCDGHDRFMLRVKYCNIQSYG